MRNSISILSNWKEMLHKRHKLNSHFKDKRWKYLSWNSFEEKSIYELLLFSWLDSPIRFQNDNLFFNSNSPISRPFPILFLYCFPFPEFHFWITLHLEIKISELIPVLLSFPSLIPLLLPSSPPSWINQHRKGAEPLRTRFIESLHMHKDQTSQKAPRDEISL